MKQKRGSFLHPPPLQAGGGRWARGKPLASSYFAGTWPSRGRLTSLDPIHDRYISNVLIILDMPTKMIDTQPTEKHSLEHVEGREKNAWMIASYHCRINLERSENAPAMRTPRGRISDNWKQKMPWWPWECPRVIEFIPNKIIRPGGDEFLTKLSKCILPYLCYFQGCHASG